MNPEELSLHNLELLLHFVLVFFFKATEVNANWTHLPHEPVFPSLDLHERHKRCVYVHEAKAFSNLSENMERPLHTGQIFEF